MSAYKIAIDHTTGIIDRRAKYYRNLVVVVSMLSLGTFGWAVVSWSFSRLAGLLLLLPVCGFFFFFDQKLLNQWRSQLFDAWVKNDVDLRNFSEAVSAIPVLPKNTLQSMLATLPSAGDIVVEQGISSCTREAIAAVVTTIQACRTDSTVLRAISFSITCGSLVVAAILWKWQLLLGTVAVIPLLLLKIYLKKLRLRNLTKNLLVTRGRPDFIQEEWLRLITSLEWEPITVVEKDELLHNWSVSPRSKAASSQEHQASVTLH